MWVVISNRMDPCHHPTGMPLSTDAAGETKLELFGTKLSARSFWPVTHSIGLRLAFRGNMSGRLLLPSARFVCRRCTSQLRTRVPRAYSTTTSAEPDIYDVVCVGGGPAGLSLLTALRTSTFPHSTACLRWPIADIQVLVQAHTLLRPNCGSPWSKLRT